MLNLLPVGSLIVLRYQPYNGGIISKFYYGVSRMNGWAVLGKEGVNDGAEDTPLWCVSVQGLSRLCVISHPDVRGSVTEEVQNPGTQWIA